MSCITYWLQVMTLSACTLVAPSLSVAATVPLYRFVDLGPGTRALDINDHGAIAGVHDNQAAIWRSGTWRHRSSGDLATAIDEQGEVVGYFENDVGTYSSLYWPRGGAPVPVLALGVANGRVVGYSQDPANKAHCFVWSADTATAVDLGVGRDGYCYAYDVNDAGQVVGEITPPGTAPRTGFIWQDGTFQYLGTLPGGDQSSAHAINRKGHVAMSATRLRHDGVIVRRPALYNGRRIVELGVLDHSPSGEALALNDVGDVVGRYYSRASGRWLQFLYTEGQMHSLESLVENLDGRQLITADAIADDGTIIGNWRKGADFAGYRLERITARDGAKQQ